MNAGIRKACAVWSRLPWLRTLPVAALLLSVVVMMPVPAAAVPLTPANLTLSKSAVATVDASGTVAYTIGIGNSGTTDTPNGFQARVSDVLPPGMVATAVGVNTNVSFVNCGGLPSSAGATLNCTVSVSTALVGGASNGAAAFTIFATAPNAGGAITNYASIDPTPNGTSAPAAGANCSPLTSCASATTTVLTPPNLTLSKTAPAGADSAGFLQYTINLGNSGQTATPSFFTARVVDVLPPGTVATAVNASTGSTFVNCGAMPSAPGATLTCILSVNQALAGGAANGAASFTINTTAPTAGGPITNYASVDPRPGGTSAPTPGPNCSPLASCGSATTTVLTPPNLTLSKTGPATANSAGFLQYTINLGNSGQTATPFSFAARVIDVLPPGTIATAVNASTGNMFVNCGAMPSAQGATLTCNVNVTQQLAGGAANGAAGFTITTTAPVEGGTITNYASVDPRPGGTTPPAPGPGCSPLASCGSATTTVLTPPNLTLSKSAPATADNAGFLQYTINLGNSGQSATPFSFTARVTDVLPPGTIATAVDGASGNTFVNCGAMPSAPGATLICSVTVVQQLAGGAANGAAAFTITTTAPAAGGPITNYASVDPRPGGTSPPAPGPGCSPLTSCGSATTTVRTPPNITVSKTAPATVLRNSLIAYTIGLGNSGQMNYPGSQVRVLDVLPPGVVANSVFGGAGVSFVNCGALPSAPGATLTCQVNINSNPLPAGAANGAVAFTINATTPNSSGPITNYAAVDPTGGNAVPTPGPGCIPLTSCASAPTQVDFTPNFTLSKSGTATASTGGALLYTLGLGNSGSAVSGTTAVVDDVLPAGVVATAATPGPGVSAVNCGTLPSAAGATLRCTATLAPTLAIGAQNGAASFTIAATAPNTGGTIVNYASVDRSGGSNPPTPGPTCTPLASCDNAASTITSPANLTLTKSATALAQTGDSVTYTLGIGNSGGSVSGLGARVADLLPAGVIATAVAPGAGVTSVNCGALPSAAGASLNCAVVLSAGLPMGAANGAASFTLTATVPNVGGTIVNYASVDRTGGNSPPTPGPSCTPLASCDSAPTTVQGRANFTLSKSGPPTAQANGALSYTLALGNSGASSSGLGAQVSEVLPAGVVATSVTAGSGVGAVNCGTLPSAAGATLNCAITLSAGLPAGAADGAAIFTLAATAPNVAGTIVNYASVDPSGGNAPPLPGATCSPIASCDSAVSVIGQPSVDVGVAMTDNREFVQVGETLNYVITVSNASGPNTATATVTNALPSELSGGSWTCTPLLGASCASGTGNTLSDVATLPVGGQAVYLYSATVQAGGADGVISNSATATVGGGSTDPNPANNTASDVPEDLIVLFKNGFDNQPLSRPLGASFATGSDFVSTPLFVNDALLKRLAIMPTVIARGIGAEREVLFTLELARFQHEVVARVLMHGARATREFSEWQSIDLEQRALQLDWQSASNANTDGFLQLTDERNLRIQINGHAQTGHLDRLQITLDGELPWLTTTPVEP